MSFSDAGGGRARRHRPPDASTFLSLAPSPLPFSVFCPPSSTIFSVMCLSSSISTRLYHTQPSFYLTSSTSSGETEVCDICHLLEIALVNGKIELDLDLNPLAHAPNSLPWLTKDIEALDAVRYESAVWRYSPDLRKLWSSPVSVSSSSTLRGEVFVFYYSCKKHRLQVRVVACATVSRFGSPSLRSFLGSAIVPSTIPVFNTRDAVHLPRPAKFMASTQHLLPTKLNCKGHSSSSDIDVLLCHGLTIRAELVALVGVDNPYHPRSISSRSSSPKRKMGKNHQNSYDWYHVWDPGLAFSFHAGHVFKLTTLERKIQELSWISSCDLRPTRLRSERQKRQSHFIQATLSLSTVSVNPTVSKNDTKFVWRILTDSTIWYDIQCQSNPATFVKPLKLDKNHVGLSETFHYLYGMEKCSISIAFNSNVCFLSLMSSKAYVAYAHHCNEQI